MRRVGPYASRSQKAAATSLRPRALKGQPDRTPQKTSGLQMAEGGNEFLIDGALERDDEIDDLVHPRPSPAIEFRLMARRLEIDLTVTAGEARGEPLLRLAAIAPAPRLPDELFRQIVTVPFRRFRDDGCGADRGFLRKLAQRRIARIFALIDAALRHLPPLPVAFGVGYVGAPADPHEAIAIEQHDADAGPIARLPL